MIAYSLLAPSIMLVIALIMPQKFITTARACAYGCAMTTFMGAIVHIVLMLDGANSAFMGVSRFPIIAIYLLMGTFAVIFIRQTIELCKNRVC